MVWPKGKTASQTASRFSTGDNCSPICGVGFMDVDASDNIWFTFSGYAGTTYGFGLGEITNVAKKPTLSIVEPIGTYGFFGGVYTSNKGTTLNVVDQQARTVSQYHLPLAPSGTPFNVLSGPVPQNGVRYRRSGFGRLQQERLEAGASLRYRRLARSGNRFVEPLDVGREPEFLHRTRGSGIHAFG